jgi:hypothetical protein
MSPNVVFSIVSVSVTGFSAFLTGRACVLRLALSSARFSSSAILECETIIRLADLLNSITLKSSFSSCFTEVPSSFTGGAELQNLQHRMEAQLQLLCPSIQQLFLRELNRLRENGFEYIPWIFFELFVAKAQTTVIFVNFKNNNFNSITNCCKFRWDV